MAEDLETRRTIALHGVLPERPTKDYLREQLSCINEWDREAELGQAESEFNRSQPDRLRNQARLQELRDHLSTRRDEIQAAMQKHYPELPGWAWYEDAPDFGDAPSPPPALAVTRMSSITDITRTMRLPITAGQLAAWSDGIPMNDAMPQLSPRERMFVATGVVPGEIDVDRPDHEIDDFVPDDFDPLEEPDLDGPDLPY